MHHIKKLLPANKLYLYLGLAWIGAWVLPWGKVISSDGNLYGMFILDMIKLGFAFGMFLVPGALLFLLLQRRPNGMSSGCSGVPAVGFALSVAMIGMIGLVGRIMGLPFLFVKYAFALIGMAEIFLMHTKIARAEAPKNDFSRHIREFIENTPLLLALMISVSITFNGHQFFIDDTTYAAYSMNWQHTAHLGFYNIVHRTDVAEQARFWLALYPMSQALLADLSGIPVILLFSNYLELFLVPLALITSYWFAGVLGLSRFAAGGSVLIQSTLYVAMISESWPVGFWFYENMVEDKVSAVFLLSPVFFTFVLRSLQNPVNGNAMLVLLSGVGLALTHPVILFFAFTIAGGMTLLLWSLRKVNVRQVAGLFLVLILLAMPSTVIRLYDRYSSSHLPFDAESASSTFQAEKYVTVVGGRYYGLNIELLKLFNESSDNNYYSVFQYVRLLPIVLVLLALGLALYKVKFGALYWYVAICSLLITFAAIPYTGWMLGYFVSARMVSRASWFLPLGLSGVMLIDFFAMRTGLNQLKVFRLQENPLDPYTRSIMTGLVFAGILLALIVAPQTTGYFATLDRNSQLARVGEYIDRSSYSSSTIVIALDYTDLQLLPSVSSRASLISFREEKEYNPHNYFMSIDEVDNRLYASNTIRSLEPVIPSYERCRLIEIYDVRFVLARVEDVKLFTNLTVDCGKGFSISFQTANMVLLEYR